MAEVAEQVGKLAKALIDGAREMGIHIKTPLRSKGPLVVLKSTNVDAVIRKARGEKYYCVRASRWTCEFRSTCTTLWTT